MATMRMTTQSIVLCSDKITLVMATMYQRGTLDPNDSLTITARYEEEDNFFLRLFNNFMSFFRLYQMITPKLVSQLFQHQTTELGNS